MSNRQVLPTKVVPVHYDLEIQIPDPLRFSYDGRVQIELYVKEATDSISLNSKEIEILPDKSSINWNEGSTQIKDVNYDTKNHVAALCLADSLPAGQTVVLDLAFAGIINGDMAGFYRSTYKNQNGEDEWMFQTQFEACDARRAFPCFDEPNLKATFTLTTSVPSHFDVVSNMPVESTEASGSLTKTRFQKSPKMSTYLLAWSIGHFEYLEEFTERLYNGKPLPVRVYTTIGLKNQAQLAVTHARKLVDFYSEIFGIDYPLPKLDLMVVHDFASNAMENWGLVTFRTTALLFDEATSDASYKPRAIYIIAHELAHQWFGNLVTMDWWSELWLNEGFATWMGWYAENALYPEWDVWGQFVTVDMQTALNLDSLRKSHPIEVPVQNALEIDQIFDEISYLKGCSTIRMLAGRLGIETFLSGISLYLKKHAYGNATTRDLWTALAQASGLDIPVFMDNWIQKIGFPVLTVAEEPGQITIRQSRFLLSGDVKPEEDETVWWVPLLLTDEAWKTSEKTTELSTKEVTLRNIDTSFYQLNTGETGYYRVNYPPARLASLGKDKDRLSVPDKIGVIADAAAMAVSGHGTTAALLSFLSVLHDETSFFVWNEVVKQLTLLGSVFAAASPDIKEGLEKFSLKLLSGAAEKTGWEGEIPDLRQRPLLLHAAGKVGHQGIIAEAQKRFKAFVGGDKSAVPPSLRRTIFSLAIANGGVEEFDAVIQEYRSTTSVDGKEICLASLASTRNPELVDRLLRFMLSDEVKAQDMRTPAEALSNNPLARHQTWAFIRENWAAIRQRLGSGIVFVLERFLKTSLNKFSDEKTLKDIHAFFADKDNTGYDRGLEVLKDAVRVNISWVNRDTGVLQEWLAANI